MLEKAYQYVEDDVQQAAEMARSYQALAARIEDKRCCHRRKGEVMPKQLIPLEVEKETVIRAVMEAHESDLFYVAILLQVLERDIGSLTPAEHFIADILMHYNVRGLTRN